MCSFDASKITLHQPFVQPPYTPYRRAEGRNGFGELLTKSVPPFRSAECWLVRPQNGGVSSEAFREAPSCSYAFLAHGLSPDDLSSVLSPDSCPTPGRLTICPARLKASFLTICPAPCYIVGYTLHVAGTKATYPARTMPRHTRDKSRGQRRPEGDPSKYI